MSKPNGFCPGCGEYNLIWLSDFNWYENPCTRYDDKSKEELISMFSDVLSKKEMQLMLEFYFGSMEE